MVPGIYEMFWKDQKGPKGYGRYREGSGTTRALLGSPEVSIMDVSTLREEQGLSPYGSF
jgi:hypothetical protein